ncbi:hypothetical protein [Sphingorhabdus sp.]|uniref:hypothetical protein n=1 Tax=Sphingorhabdus sp. TaxID=1902408 RepID=UPI0035ADEC61
MRILVFLSSKEYVRNYITTDAFARIAGHELGYLLSPEVAARIDADRLALMNVVPLVASDGECLRKRAFTLNNQLQMYDKRNRNPNFIFRLRRELIQNIYTLFVVPKRLYVSADNTLLKYVPAGVLRDRVAAPALAVGKIARNVLREIPGLIKYAMIAATVRLGLKPLLSAVLWRGLSLDEGIATMLRAERPDLVVVPSAIVDAKIYELMRASARLGIGKVLLLIDNWDNLSSKSAFINKPDFIGVMGQQSVGFAVDIHEIDGRRVTRMGTPRFEVYKEYFRQRARLTSDVAKRPIAGPYILFAGCAVGFDELGALRALSRALSSVRDKLPEGTRILYRPHPWGARERYLGILAETPIEHVQVDPQIEAGSQFAGDNFQPELSYYPHLLAESLMVVCPLSTMILEATIMRKQVLALVHEDGVSLFSPNRMLANYRHFEGLERLENLALIADFDELGAAMCKACEVGDTSGWPTGLDYFVDVAEPEYAERLARLVDSIASGSPPA